MAALSGNLGAPSTAETVRKWVRQADIDDGVVDGVSSAKRQQIKDLQGEVRERRRANEILKAASVCVAEPVCPEKGQDQGRDRRAAVLTDRAQWAAYQRVGKNSGAVAPAVTASGGTAIVPSPPERGQDPHFPEGYGEWVEWLGHHGTIDRVGFEGIGIYGAGLAACCISKASRS